MARATFRRIIILWILALVSQGHGSTTVTPLGLVITTTSSSTPPPPPPPSTAGQTDTTTASSAGNINAIAPGDVNTAAASSSGGAGTGSQASQTSAGNNSSLTDASPANAAISSDITTSQSLPVGETSPTFVTPVTGSVTSVPLTSQGSDLTTQALYGLQGLWIDTQAPVMSQSKDTPVSDQTGMSTPSPYETQGNFTSAQPPSCDIISAGRCLQAGLQDLSQSLFFLFVFRNPRITVPYFCGKFRVHRSCLQEHLQNCTSQQRLRYDVLLAGMGFLCSGQGPQVVADVLPCLQSTQTGSGLARCSAAAQPALRQGDMCSMMTAYSDCSSQVFAACSRAAAHGIRNLLHSTFAPFRLVSGCLEGQTTQPPTTPLPPAVGVAATTAAAVLPLLPSGTLTPQRPPVQSKPSFQLKCYECSSGASGRLFNEFCAPDGDVNRRHLGGSPCNAPCYARVLKNFLGVTYVQRGCAAAMESSFPGGIPTFGCRQTFGGTICFCSHRNGCNIQDMEQYMEQP